MAVDSRILVSFAKDLEALVEDLGKKWRFSVTGA